MRTVLFISVIFAGAMCMSPRPATAAPQALPGIAAAKASALVEEVGWRRRYWRYGYRAPYAYYLPAYGYYPPRYYAPVYPAYPYYAPYRYYRPYYAPY